MNMKYKNLQEFLGEPKQFNPEYQDTPELRANLNDHPKVKEAFNNLGD